jgi:hypothetical protein
MSPAGGTGCGGRAYLLCGDWHTADDLVSMTLTAGPAGTGSIRRRPVLPVGAGPGAGSAC